MPLPVSVPGLSSIKGSGSSAPASTYGGGPSATSGTNYSNPSNFNPSGFDINSITSGQPGYAGIMSSMPYIQSPNTNNYTIAGMGQYQGQMGQIAKNYTGIGNTAQSQAATAAGTGVAQNSAYQGNVNSTTQSFLNNASGLGNYDNNAAAQGSDQQNAAYNAITNMAQGNGPSLAGKNLQAGLNQQNQAVQAQSMSNQGLGGAGNASRNALNAQAANTDNQLENAQQASTAEQLGALSQQNTAANNIRSSNQAQASASSSAGLAQRSLNSSALNNQYAAQLAGNSLQDNNTLNANAYGTSAALQATSGQAGAYNNQFNASNQQTNDNMGFDAASQAAGAARASTNTAAITSQANQEAGTGSFLGNLAQGLGSLGSDIGDLF